MRFVTLCLLLAACSPSTPNPNAPDALAARKASQRACVAKGEVVIAMGLAQHEPCADVTARLQKLVREDGDCLVYFGDAGVQVKDLCE